MRSSSVRRKKEKGKEGKNGTKEFLQSYRPLIREGKASMGRRHRSPGGAFYKGGAYDSLREGKKGSAERNWIVLGGLQARKTLRGRGERKPHLRQ